MNRRTFLRLSASTLALAFMPAPASARVHAPAIPILMFHKINDAPGDPESVSGAQLAALFGELWELGFCPVNASDILDGKVDELVPRGLKPVGVTADDAHSSVLFFKNARERAGLLNARPLAEIFRASLKPSGLAPRATFFISRVEDDRISKQPGEYFGGYKTLPAILDELDALPGLEIGYHTLNHIKMTRMDAGQVREIIQKQQDDFASLGVLDRVAPVLAYPYGVPPAPEGLRELRRLGFKGAVTAYPGMREGRANPPACEYDGRLLSDPFLVPRVCIGSHTYTRPSGGGLYAPIDPREDFRKDVLEALPHIYVSKGA